MMPLELSCHRNMMAKNSPLHFSPTHSQTPNGNGAVQNGKPLAFIMLYQIGTTIYKDLTMLYPMTSNLYRNFLMVKMQTTN